VVEGRGDRAGRVYIGSTGPTGEVRASRHRVRVTEFCLFFHFYLAMNVYENPEPCTMWSCVHRKSGPIVS
jgi:hypothetical protein